MPTAQQLKNDAAEALAAARRILDEKGAGEEYKAAYADFEAKKSAHEAAVAIEAEERSFTVSEKDAPKASDLRNPADADWIPTATKGELEKNVDGVMIKGDNGQPAWMPYAGPGREGWIKGLPVSAQHPSILKRLPDELALKKAKEEEAFNVYLRKGLKGFRDNEALYTHLKDLQEGTDSEGGYLVPTDQRTDIVVPPGTPGGVLRPISSVYTTTRDAGTWPRLSTDLSLAAVAEEAAFAESDPAFDQVPFTIHKVGRAVDLSQELLADSAVNLPALLGARFTAAKGRYEDQQGIEGDGSTEPLGLRTTGHAAGNISDVTDLFTLAAPTAAEVINAFYELGAEYRANSSWFMTSSFFSRVLAIGATAAGIHLVETIGDAVTPRILGRPVYFFDGTGWDDAATISANEELGAIGDFRNYAFIDRAGMTVERSDDVAFRTDQVVFKARVRYDSVFLDNSAFLILKAAAS
ncbi:MAG: phage major capsid protein [Candidatus Nanopelagicales bacterium]